MKMLLAIGAVDPRTTRQGTKSTVDSEVMTRSRGEEERMAADHPVDEYIIIEM